MTSPLWNPGNTRPLKVPLEVVDQEEVVVEAQLPEVMWKSIGTMTRLSCGLDGSLNDDYKSTSFG